MAIRIHETPGFALLRGGINQLDLFDERINRSKARAWRMILENYYLLKFEEKRENTKKKKHRNGRVSVK